MRYAQLLDLAVQNEKNKNWYNRARLEIRKLSKLFNVDYNTVAGITAITSQNVRLEFNSVLVLEWLKNGANLEACDKIRHYSIVKKNAKLFLETGVVRGKKVSQFYNALIGKRDSVVLDTHMLSAFGFNSWTQKNRTKAVSTIKKISKKLNWHESQTQAAIWCGIYKSKNPTKKRVANFQFSKLNVKL